MPTLEELMRAQFLDNMAVGRSPSAGMSGAVDHARSRDWANFMQSHVGRLLAGDPRVPQGALTQAFESRYGQGNKFGSMPNPGALDRLIAQQTSGVTGTQSAPTQSVSVRQERGRGRGQRRRGPDPNELLMQLLQNAEQERLAAKQANIDRFDRGDMMYRDRTNRVMGEVENWGKAAGADLDERFNDALNTQIAINDARGLGNASTVAAFTGDNRRDLAREQMRLSENISNRKANFDQQLSKEHADFVERRDDVGPDMSQVFQLAQLLGQSNGGQGFDTGAPVSNVAATVPSVQRRRPVMTPWGQAQQASYFPQGRLPVQANMFAGMGLPFQMPQGTTSNRYPEVLPPLNPPEDPVQRRAGVRRRNVAARRRRLGRNLNQSPRAFDPNVHYV